MPTSAGHDRQSGRDADTLIRKRSWEPAREPPERTLSLDAGIRRTARRHRLHATNQFEPGSKFGGYLRIRRSGNLHPVPGHQGDLSPRSQPCPPRACKQGYLR